MGGPRISKLNSYESILEENGDSRDGGKAPRLTLNDGNSIPTVGLGTFLAFEEHLLRVSRSTQKQERPDDLFASVTAVVTSPDQHEAGVGALTADRSLLDVEPGDLSTPLQWAIEAGYRLVDTASAYKNEEDVGIGIRNAISNGTIRREDMYVVTKLGSTEQRNVVPALRRSLRKLNMDYVDLYLIHSPMAFAPKYRTFDVIDYLDTWKSMEETKKLGLAKSIGLANFNQSQIQRILDNAEINPSVLQVEVNLNFAQDRIIEYAKSKGIVVMAYTPFGSIFESQDSANPPPRVDDPQLRSIAERYGKTVPQIVLRYLVSIYRTRRYVLWYRLYISYLQPPVALAVIGGMSCFLFLIDPTLVHFPTSLSVPPSHPLTFSVVTLLLKFSLPVSRPIPENEVPDDKRFLFLSLESSNSAASFERPKSLTSGDISCHPLPWATKDQRLQVIVFVLSQVQRGLVPIPKSIHKNRIEKNIDLFNFELTPEEMKTLAGFNKDYRLVHPSFWQDHPYYPYERKEVPSKS
ncbi:Aldo-keto reductase AKR2E4 [Eumeta japonica]|uniref:Aldo-keto reductase AKR2E4 n=1 Tax=Eumeta variegata TaxID=151549 RepID=A0A4C1TXK9_EUMVA|nr:Aldo-keto reductase AKR2E4 [Eumeta japonica]